MRTDRLSPHQLRHLLLGDGLSFFPAPRLTWGFLFSVITQEEGFEAVIELGRVSLEFREDRFADSLALK